MAPVDRCDGGLRPPYGDCGGYGEDDLGVRF